MSRADNHLPRGIQHHQEVQPAERVAVAARGVALEEGRQPVRRHHRSRAMKRVDVFRAKSAAPGEVERPARRPWSAPSATPAPSPAGPCTAAARSQHAPAPRHRAAHRRGAARPSSRSRRSPPASRRQRPHQEVVQAHALGLGVEAPVRQQRRGLRAHAGGALQRPSPWHGVAGAQTKPSGRLRATHAPRCTLRVIAPAPRPRPATAPRPPPGPGRSPSSRHTRPPGTPRPPGTAAPAPSGTVQRLHTSVVHGVAVVADARPALAHARAAPPCPSGTRCPPQHAAPSGSRSSTHFSAPRRSGAVAAHGRGQPGGSRPWPRSRKHHPASAALRAERLASYAPTAGGVKRILSSASCHPPARAAPPP